LKINFGLAKERLPNTLSITFPERFQGSQILKHCSGKLYASLGAACHSNVEKPSSK